MKVSKAANRLHGRDKKDTNLIWNGSEIGPPAYGVWQGEKMTRVKLNPMFEELHGKFGEIVYRKSYGKQRMSRNPNMTGVVPSAEQVAQRERFRQAAVYARLAFADEVARLLYESVAKQREKPILAVMIADFLHAPSIDDLDVSAYEGRIGSPIYILATDDFAVQTVQVKIMDTNGQTLESGLASIEAGGTVRAM